MLGMLLYSYCTSTSAVPSTEVYRVPVAVCTRTKYPLIECFVQPCWDGAWGKGWSTLAIWAGPPTIMSGERESREIRASWGHGKQVGKLKGWLYDIVWCDGPSTGTGTHSVL